jgi:hypothetical protein
MTSEARRALGQASVRIDHTPFRFGRECRSGRAASELDGPDRRAAIGTVPTNDVYLRDRGRRLRVSRHHFAIVQDEDGSFELRDCGSTCGTVVDEVSLGANEDEERRSLRHGSIVVVGGLRSPFMFQFLMTGDNGD